MLLFPGISGIGFNSYGKGTEESWISHGLCNLSSAAQQAGFPVEMIDLRCLRGWKDLARIIGEKKPDVVGVTMMSVDFNPAIKSIRTIKAVSPKTVTVVGGPHPSIAPQEVLDQPEIDHVITGEGEVSFIDFLRDLQQGNKPDRLISGIATEDLDSLPFADRLLFGDLEQPVGSFERPFVTVIAGRGCKFNCSFCQPAERLIFGKKVRRRSPANVIAELETLRDRFAFKSMMIHDDCLTEDEEWITEFCRFYREKGFDQPFACQGRADIVCKNEDMIGLLAETGLRIMYIGFESGNQRVLKFLRKGTRVEHNYQAANICRQNGIKVAANYMMGIPTETREEVMDTVRMIKKIDPDYHQPSFYTPLPGSDLYAYCEEQGLSLVTDHDGYRRNATDPKIKGVDYDYLWKSLMEARGVTAFGSNPLLLKLQTSLMIYLLKRPRLKNRMKAIISPLGLIHSHND